MQPIFWHFYGIPKDPDTPGVFFSVKKKKKKKNVSASLRSGLLFFAVHPNNP